MNRYQVYLNPTAVNIIDEFSEKSQYSRSELIREAVDQLAKNLTQILMDFKPTASNKPNLNKLIGLIAPPRKKTTNFASKPDASYL